jgi:hypothetical protein
LSIAFLNSAKSQKVEAERNAAQELAFEAQDKASETEFRLLQQASATAQVRLK